MIERSEVDAGSDEATLVVAIEAHASQTMPWQQAVKSGPREDRMLREVTVSLPPKIQDLDPRLSSQMNNLGDHAIRAITRLDSVHGDHLDALSVLLLRSESIASSKIELVEASMEDFARAAHGTKSNESATSMVASAVALDSLIHSVERQTSLKLDAILAAHQVLMRDDAHESRYAGRMRDMQNWIGGSDHAPRNALYVPPPPDTLDDYLDDLLRFMNRDEVPVLVQVAIAHAQFESIHPFTDGNGRIGRALVNTILRRRGVTSRIVVPIASALVARRETYFDVLTAYRSGDAGPVTRAFMLAALIASAEAETTAQRLARLPDTWRAMYLEAVGRAPRAGSAASRILDQLLTTPFFTADEIEGKIGGATSSLHAAIKTLAAAGILRPLTNRIRQQVWCAGAVIDELEDFGARVATESVAHPEWRNIHHAALNGVAKLRGERGAG